MHTRFVVLSSLAALSWGAYDYGAVVHAGEPAQQARGGGWGDEFEATEVRIGANHAREQVQFVTALRQFDNSGNANLPNFEPDARLSRPARTGDVITDKSPSRSYMFVSRDWKRIYIAHPVKQNTESRSSSYSEGGRTVDSSSRTSVLTLVIPSEPSIDYDAPPPARVGEAPGEQEKLQGDCEKEPVQRPWTNGRPGTWGPRLGGFGWSVQPPVRRPEQQPGTTTTPDKLRGQDQTQQPADRSQGRGQGQSWAQSQGDGFPGKNGLHKGKTDQRRDNSWDRSRFQGASSRPD